MPDTRAMFWLAPHASTVAATAAEAVVDVVADRARVGDSAPLRDEIAVDELRALADNAEGLGRVLVPVAEGATNVWLLEALDIAEAEGQQYATAPGTGVRTPDCSWYTPGEAM